MNLIYLHFFLIHAIDTSIENYQGIWHESIFLKVFNSQNFMNYISIIISLLTILCLGCEKVERGATMTLDVSEGFQVNEKRNLSEFAQEVRYIQLETSPPAIIGDIKRVVLAGNKLFIHDNQLNQLLVFDKDGEFIRKIGAKGEGPEEYKSIISFDISTDFNRVIIFDNDQMKFLFYDLRGKYLGYKRAPYYALEIKVIPHQRAFFLITPRGFSQNSRGCKLTRISFDIDENKPQKMLCENTEINSNVRTSFFSTYYENDMLCYWESDKNVIYQFDAEGSIVKRTTINMGIDGVSRKLERDPYQLEKQISKI